MTTTKKTIHNIRLTHAELIALQEAHDVLSEITAMFGTQATLMSAETGEVVELDELSRVRGVLSFFREYRVFEITD